MSTETKYQEQVEVTRTFAENVRALMDKAGIGITELAKMADVDRGGLTNLLNGKGGNCSFATGQKIAEALKTPLWKLIKP